jgi:alanyl-tRNA synthetase
MTTDRLYYDDAYLREFDAAIVERREHEGRPAVALDRTAFYPESGGQPWDKGTLDGVDVIQVIDVDGSILHVTAAEVAGPKVHGVIDWPARFDHMQQHTGQHVLSQAFFEKVRGETRSFHLGQDVSTLEIGLRTITDDELDRVEDRANAIVWEDREVKAYFVPEERIHEVPLRRPPKKTGLLRVIEVAGYDYSACGGTHCRKTGEIGIIKVLGFEKIRGNLRFEFLCGGRALADHRMKDRNARRIAAGLSSAVKDTAAAVDKLAADFKALRKRARRLEERVAHFDALEIIRSEAGPVIAGVLEDRSPEEARFLALNIIKNGTFTVLYGAAGESQDHLIFARSEPVAVDLRELVPVVGAVVPVKGGGGPSLVELVTPEKGRLAEAVAVARSWIGERARSGALGGPEPRGRS